MLTKLLYALQAGKTSGFSIIYYEPGWNTPRLAAVRFIMNRRCDTLPLVAGGSLKYAYASGKFHFQTGAGFGLNRFGLIGVFYSLGDRFNLKRLPLAVGY